MRLEEHFQITRTALLNWFVGQMYDAVIVGLLWLIGLLWIQVPLAPLWAVIAAILQLVPIIGTVLALLGPTIAALVTGDPDRMLYVIALYAAIAVIDGLLLQPLIFKRTARVPVWASILAPLVLGAFLGIWGVLLSVPLLAVIYAYRSRHPAPQD